MNSSIVFARWRQCALPSNMWFPGLTSRVHMTNNILNLFSCLCASHNCDRPTDIPCYSFVTTDHIYVVLPCSLIILRVNPHAKHIIMLMPVISELSAFFTFGSRLSDHYFCSVCLFVCLCSFSQPSSIRFGSN